MENPPVDQINEDQVRERAREFIQGVASKKVIQIADYQWQHFTPEWVRYHRPSHTEDVVNEAVLFAIADGVTDEKQLELLVIAAKYHDVGMTIQRNTRTGHEGVGAHFAAVTMKALGYSGEEIEVVVGLIEDTTIIKGEDGILRQQEPKDILGNCLLDADVSNFGRDDFSEKSDLEFEELKALLGNEAPTRTDFNETTLGLIKNKVWFSSFAKRFRQPKWKENVASLEQAA